MNNEILIAVLAGLGGMLGWGLADLFAKKTIDAIGDVASLWWAHLFGTIILGAVVVYQSFTIGHFSLPSSQQDMVFLALFGALQAIVYFFVYKGFGKGQVSVLNPIFASFSGIVALVSIIIFGEIVTGSIAISLAFVFIGVLMLNLDPSAFANKKLALARVPGFAEVAIATILATVWTLGWDHFIGGRNWVVYAFFMYLFMTITVYIIARVQNVVLIVKEKRIWKWLVLIGLCETIAYLAISWGYDLTSKTSVVALLSGAFSLPTIFLARAFLKERTTRLQFVGALVIIAGVVLLSVV